jgi:predicted porin
MKKVLLGTTALAALVALPVTAQAAEKIKLGLGGYFRAVAVYGDQDDGVGQAAANTRDHGLARESEVYFKGNTTLDNGIKFGVMIQLEGETSGDQIDNSYIWTSGGFGRIEFGSTWDPALIMSYGSVGEMIDGHGDFGSHNHPVAANAPGAPNTYTGNAGIAGTPNDLIVYYSPRMSGFQIGVSYSPDDKGAVGPEEDGSALDSEIDALGGSTASEMVVVAANYVGKFSNASVALFGAYATTTWESPVVGVSDGDVEGFSLGAQVSFSGFTVGGRWTEHEIDLPGAVAFSPDQETYRIGVAYSTGPWTIGANYINEELDTSTTTTDETDYFSVGARYNLGPGIVLFGGIQNYDYQVGGGGPLSGNDATTGIIGTKLSF